LQRSVELGRVEQRSLDVYVETVGALEGEAHPEIAAGVSGLVDEVLFREGQWVERGTVLLKVEQRRYEALLAQAEATVEKAAANIKKAEANIEKARASRDHALRMQDLKEGQLRIAREARVGVSRQELEEKEAEVKLARAAVQEAVFAIAVAQAELAAAVKEAEAAQALRRLAEHNLSLSRVKAPFSGQINQRRVAPGMFVEDRSVVATMADLSRLRLVGWVPEKAAPTVRTLMQAEQSARAARLAALMLGDRHGLGGLGVAALESIGELRLPTTFALEFRLLPYPDRLFRARIFYLSTVANPETHLFECKAEVDLKDVEVELKPGYMASIRAPIRGNANALVVPEEAVRASERGFVAFVPEPRQTRDGKEEWVARARPVELGYRSGLGSSERSPGQGDTAVKEGMVEILRGLKKGEWVVTRGAESLEDGTPIAIPPRQLKEVTGE
jgi:multidrug efflux system membrane fusion protein